jgi:hypothetical protein
MRPLRTGQEAVLSWSAGAIDCRVVAAAGSYVLLRPLSSMALMDEPPGGQCSLTYLDGMVPMGWDGQVEPASVPGELRFRTEAGVQADRRSSVRVPIFVDAVVHALGAPTECQVLDVSAGGMRLRTAKRRFAVGSVVHIRAQLPNAGPAVDADAVVRQSEPGVAAVEFTNLRADVAREIGAWTVERLRASLPDAPQPSSAGSTSPPTTASTASRL